MDHNQTPRTPTIDPLANVPPPILPSQPTGIPASVVHKLRLIKRSQYVGLLSLVVVFAAGVFFMVNVQRFSGDYRSRASNSSTPAPTPAYCNSICGSNAGFTCPTNLKCIDGFCRNPSCFGSATCICAPVPASPTSRPAVPGY